jgi:hypothetical protein
MDKLKQEVKSLTIFGNKIVVYQTSPVLARLVGQGCTGQVRSWQF